MHEEHTHAGDHSIGGAEVGRTFPGAIEDEQLLLDEHGFSRDSTHAAGTGESGDGRQQMEKQDAQIAHGTTLTSSRNPRNVEQSINSPWTGVLLMHTWSLDAVTIVELHGRLPAIRTDTRTCAALVSARVRRAPVQPRMHSMTVIVTLEIEELPLEIRHRSEEGAVQTFAPNGANQPFNEWMRERHVRHGLDFFHVEYPQIRLPLMEPIQGSW